MISEWLDLNDKHGRPDHGKRIGFVFFVTAIAMELFDKGLAADKLLILAVAIYGSRMMMAFLRNRSADAILAQSRSDEAGPPVSE